MPVEPRDTSEAVKAVCVNVFLLIGLACFIGLAKEADIYTALHSDSEVQRLLPARSSKSGLVMVEVVLIAAPSYSPFDESNWYSLRM